MECGEMETGCKRPLEPMHSCCIHKVDDKGYDVSQHQCCALCTCVVDPGVCTTSCHCPIHCDSSYYRKNTEEVGVPTIRRDYYEIKWPKRIPSSTEFCKEITHYEVLEDGNCPICEKKKGNEV
jgi:hypothetical protein